MKVIDMHCDTIGELMKYETNENTFMKNILHIDITKLKAGDYMLQNFAMFVNMKEYPDCYKRCKEMIAYWNMLKEKYREHIEEINCVDNVIILCYNKAGCKFNVAVPFFGKYCITCENLNGRVDVE